MKRYEQMSKEEIMGIFGMPFNCPECEIREFCNSCRRDTCVETRAAYLNQEIKIVPRVATINTAEELKKAWDDYMHRKIPRDVFYDYLAEEIEVEE